MTVEQISGIRCPALFIAGEHDRFASESRLQRLCSLVQGSHYVIVPSGSYRPHMLRESPQLVNDLILDFLLRHPL